MARSKSSRRWLDRQAHDPYVQRAQAEGWRSRAAFKLLELDAKDRFLRPGARVVDLGAAPGGWSQVAQKAVGAGGQVLALDLLPMEPIPGVTFLQGDFREEEVLRTLEARLGQGPVDVVISDMAPNVSGMAAVDQPRATHLAELALAFAEERLAKGGSLVVKLFQGAGFDPFVAQCRQRFARVALRKPAASRPESREVYLVARGFGV
ncbi:MAG: 23S rRNA (uridine(2552)-2'-O)-methyltransferase RlmE [Thermoanaerobaculales bacterium]|nr:23S rRNA (uridine(2552)-2'-O)-methyltransferase RlmE [Thermoanaerobaculales bacterium]